MILLAVIVSTNQVSFSAYLLVEREKKHVTMCDCNCSCVTILTVSRDYEYNRRLDKQIQQEDPKTAHTTIHGKCTEICIICQNSYLD